MNNKNKISALTIDKAENKESILFEKYNNDGFAIKGSWAIKIMFSDFTREPNDIDLIMIDKNENLDYRFNLFKKLGYVKEIKEKFDFFQWDQEGTRVETMLTVSPFSTIVQEFHGKKIVTEDPFGILGQKTLSTIVFFFLKTIDERKQNTDDILFLLEKYSLSDVTDEMIEHFIKDHFKLEQEKISMYFVSDWKKQYAKIFGKEVIENILSFMERVETIAADEKIYLEIKTEDYFNFKEWNSKNDKL